VQKQVRRFFFFPVVGLSDPCCWLWVGRFVLLSFEFFFPAWAGGFFPSAALRTSLGHLTGPSRTLPAPLPSGPLFSRFFFGGGVLFRLKETPPPFSPKSRVDSALVNTLQEARGFQCVNIELTSLFLGGWDVTFFPPQ